MSEQATFFQVADWRSQMLEGGRTLVWFSCGITSAVAAKLSVDKYAGKRPLRILYCDPGSENEDNPRFLRDVERWIGHEIEVHRNPGYQDVDDVIERERYLNGPDGAKCTAELKKWVRHQLQRVDSDIQVFGYDFGERNRAMKFERNNPEVVIEWPLIDAKLTKGDCFRIVEAAGIAIPEMYRLGYRNNNCIGCVKGGKGYWNKIRVDFPEVFARRAKQERMIGHSCIKGAFLDELDPTAGNYKAEPSLVCGVACNPNE